MIASAVGGIADQIVDGESGLLLADPADLAAFSKVVGELVEDRVRREALGASAYERVVAGARWWPRS